MNFNDLSILVTGGAGFIGSHITEYLLKNGAKMVRVLDNLSTGTMNNLNGLITTYPNLEFMWGDITNLDTCRKACANMSVICHQAALGSVPRSVGDPLTSHNSNVNGFLNILLAAKENDIKRVVYASSSSVYGNNTDSVKKEDVIGKPLSPYAITKYIDEMYGRIFSMLYEMECIGLRYFNVFGPRQNPNGAYAAVIPKFTKMICQGENPIINGDGSYSRDFTYVDNVVFANCLALTTKNNECYGEVFNVGTNNTITINDLFYSIRNIVGNTDCEPIYGPYRKGDVPYSNASIDKISKYLGYCPLVYFNDGLIKTVHYFMNQPF